MSDRLNALARRFPHLPRNCGQAEPGVSDSDEWRDWTLCDTTPDQLRIEDYLDRFDLAGKSILHIGIGNSGLAQRFHRRAARIAGTTVVPGELAFARSLGIANYAAVLHNKYAASRLEGRYDFIVDNNPTTFCCCLEHLDAMLSLYTDLLSPRGQIVTDEIGLGWSLDVATAQRWGFSFDDLAAAAAPAGLSAHRTGRRTIVLARQTPGRPPIAGRLAYRVRKAIRRLRRLV